MYGAQGLHSGHRQRQLQRADESAQGTSFYQMVKYHRWCPDMVPRPDIESFTPARAEALGEPPTPAFEWSTENLAGSAWPGGDIVTGLRPKVSSFPDCGLHLHSAGYPRRRPRGDVQKQLYFTLYGPDTQTLYEIAPRLERIVPRSLPGLQEVSSDLQIKTPRVKRRSGPRPGRALGVN